MRRTPYLQRAMGLLKHPIRNKLPIPWDQIQDLAPIHIPPISEPRGRSKKVTIIGPRLLVTDGHAAKLVKSSQSLMADTAKLVPTSSKGKERALDNTAESRPLGDPEEVRTKFEEMEIDLVCKRVAVQ